MKQEGTEFAHPVEHIKVEYDVDFLNCGDEDESESSVDNIHPSRVKRTRPRKAKRKITDEAVDSPKLDFNPRIAPGSVLTPFSEICYLCSFCDINLKRKNNVVRHMRTFHDAISKPFGCSYCNLRFTEESRKNSHESTEHEHEKPSTIFCETCGASGSSKEGMKHHTLRDHVAPLTRRKSCKPSSSNQNVFGESSSSDKKLTFISTTIGEKLDKYNPRPLSEFALLAPQDVWFSCNFCDHKMKPRENMLRHILEKHDPAENPFACHFCIDRFKSLDEFNSHELENHAFNVQVKVFFCDVCGISGDNYDGIAIHKNDDHLTTQTIARSSEKAEKPIIKRLKRFNPRPSRGSEFLDYNDAYYKCNFCEKELKPRKNILRHIKTKHDPEDRPFGCGYCIERFITDYDLEVHEAELHKDCKTKTIFFCDLCGVSGDRKDGMDHHMIDDHLKLSAKVDGSFKFSCSRCRLRFKHKRSLEQHIAAHHEEIKCDQCNEKFIDKTKLQHHKIIVHEQVIRELAPNEVVQEIKCCVCNQNFPSEAELSTHLEDHRKTFDSFSCQLCQMQLKNFDSCISHSKYHVKPKTHQCLKCLKIFPLDGKLIAHVAGHKRSEQPRPHQCNKCDSKFKTAWKLSLHDKVKHQNLTLFICPFCAKSLATASVLDTHIRYVHNREKELKFECKICNKKFTKKVALDRHETTHSTDRPHICEQCGAAFKTKDGLGVHIKRHDGTYKKDIPCPQCSFKFHDNHRLQLHLLTHAGVVSCFLEGFLSFYLKRSFNFHRNLTSVNTATAPTQAKEISSSICKRFTSVTPFTSARSVHLLFRESSN